MPDLICYVDESDEEVKKKTDYDSDDNYNLRLEVDDDDDNEEFLPRTTSMAKKSTSPIKFLLSNRSRAVAASNTASANTCNSADNLVGAKKPKRNLAPPAALLASTAKATAVVTTDARSRHTLAKRNRFNTQNKNGRTKSPSSSSISTV